MSTFNIYSNNNGEDTEPSVVVTLDDSNTEIVEIVGDTPETQAEAEEVLKSYVDAGFTAVDALFRYAGSYGTVESADGEETPVEEPVEALEAATETEAEEEPELETDAPAAPTPEAIPDGIMAMANDAGLVVTLLQKGADGPEYRHGSEWLPVVDPSVFDGLAFVGVDDDGVEVYDNHENEGMLVPISEYTPSLEGPFWPGEVEGDEDLVLDEETGIYEKPGEADEEIRDEEPLAASVTLDSADDLTAAIAAAIEDPELRWYVERRVSALGLEADLPWQQD